MYGSPSSVAEQEFHAEREAKRSHFQTEKTNNDNLTPLKSAAETIANNLRSGDNDSINEAAQKDSTITFDELKAFFIKCSSNITAGVKEATLVLERVGNSKEKYCEFNDFAAYLQRKLAKFPIVSRSMYVQTLISLSEDIARERLAIEQEKERENVGIASPSGAEKEQHQRRQRKSSERKKRKKKKTHASATATYEKNDENVAVNNIENVKPSSVNPKLIPKPPTTLKNNPSITPKLPKKDKPLSILNVKAYNDSNKKKSKRQENMDLIRSLSAVSEQKIDKVAEQGKGDAIKNIGNNISSASETANGNQSNEDSIDFDDNIPPTLKASLSHSPLEFETSSSQETKEKSHNSTAKPANARSSSHQRGDINIADYVLKSRYKRMKEKIKSKENEKRINEVNQLKEMFTAEIKEIKSAFQKSSKEAENIIDSLQMSEKKSEYAVQKLQTKLEKANIFVTEFHKQEKEFQQKMKFFAEQEKKNNMIIEQQKLKISQQQLKMDLLRDTIKKKDKQCQDITKHHQKMLDTSLKAAKKYYTKLYRRDSNSSDSSSSSSPGGGR